MCVVFDPEAVRHLEGADPHKVIRRIDTEVAAGNLLLYNPAGSGDYRLLFFIEEPPPPSLLARTFFPQENLLLRLPSGTIAALGLEQLPHRSSERAGQRAVSIAPGLYRVDGYNLEVPEGASGWPDERDADAVFVLHQITDPAEAAAMKGGILAL